MTSKPPLAESTHATRIEIAQRPGSLAAQKNLLSLCVPVTRSTNEDVPDVIQLSECSIRSHPPLVPIANEKLNAFRLPNVITGVTRLHSIMAAYMAHEVTYPDTKTNFITLFYRSCTESDEHYLSENPSVKIIHYLRQQWVSNGRDLTKQDSFLTDWATSDLIKAVSNHFEDLMVKQAGISEDDFSQIKRMRVRMIDFIFANYPFAVHKFFEQYQQLHVLRHQVWPDLLNASIYGGVSVRLTPDRIAYAEITGDLKGHAKIVY